MLKRDDFSKEFGLVVQQEIKNFNDLSDGIHKSINKLNERIDNLEKSFQEKISNQFSTIVSLKSLNELEVKSIKERQNFHEVSIQEVGRQLLAMQKFLQDFKKDYEIHCALNSNSLDEYITYMHEYENHMICLKEHLNNTILELNAYRNESKKYTDQVKKEILDRPSEAQQVKNDIESKMNIDRVDFNGAMREIALLKKDLHYAVKRIEHLYVLLERNTSGKT